MLSDQRLRQDELVRKCNQYLGNDGLFNPELMAHENVRDLIIELRDHITLKSDEVNHAVPAPQALQSVVEERQRQEAKWGEQNHSPFIYLTILMEEVGELAQAIWETWAGGKNGGLDNMRAEAVQTAAVAMAIVECLDRGKWTFSDVLKQTPVPCDVPGSKA